MIELAPNIYLLDLVVALLGGASVFMLVWSIFRYPVPAEPPISRRIAMAMGVGGRQTIFEQPLLRPITSMFLQLAKQFGFTYVRNRIRRDLNASGNPSGYTVDEYIAICMMAGGAFAMMSSIVTLMFFGFPEPATFLLTFLIGFWIPMMTLRGQADARVRRISKKLPYTLDLIALMMGAGGTFGEAIDTIIRDEPEDDLNQELALVQSEIEFGTMRSTALRNMADRIPLESLRSVVSAINQSESLGTPLSAILSTQAQIIRMHRSVRAEKLSASASLKIQLPSMLILIAVLLIVFAPLIIKFSEGRLFEF